MEYISAAARDEMGYRGNRVVVCFSLWEDSWHAAPKIVRWCVYFGGPISGGNLNRWVPPCVTLIGGEGKAAIKVNNGYIPWAAAAFIKTAEAILTQTSSQHTTICSISILM